ncbi:hypothetical protein [Aeromicrobium wangtongii]|uniref:Uncharacterized protein n=1 Tax=Aeromicrobium wangtongii TaxID=2969247 RepID=A0ABY5MAQ9_9ACTN|nr:hypothetical protein [Aeromicrobium wangtongii]MCD9199731.1 hypothetical protein [Aeromicrobium wangtongii]UUP14080.1 hypothetical protein NQV15_01865 [Aeromicrobium wangtongii]
MDDSEDQPDDHWTGSPKKPWLNPPMTHKLGAGRGAWRWGMLVIAVVVLLVIVLAVLVNTGRLSNQWLLALIPLAIIAAAVPLVLTVFKASAEEKLGPKDQLD